MAQNRRNNTGRLRISHWATYQMSVTSTPHDVIRYISLIQDDSAAAAAARLQQMF